MRFLPSGNKKAIQEWLQYGCIHKWTYKVYSKWLGKNRFYCTVRIIGHKVMCKFTSPPLATRPAQQTCAATWKLSFGVRRVFERVGMQSCTVPKMIFFSAPKNCLIGFFEIPIQKLPFAEQNLGYSLSNLAVFFRFAGAIGTSRQ